MRRIAARLIALVVLAGCASHAPASQTPARPQSSTSAPHENLNAVLWVQTALEYEASALQAYRLAALQLDAALADPSWTAAIEQKGDASKLPPAVILDIDETVLDNSPSQVRQIREHRGFNEAAWGEWVNERKARPLPGAVEFLTTAAKKGVTVFYISNRDASLAEATLANLRQAGFPVESDSQFLGLGTVVDGCEQEGSEKACRRQLVARSHRVLMQFGDQVGDFVQVTANTRDGRREAIAPYQAWIGERWWALPNPLYGSWEPALFDNNWRQPERARRAAKEAELDAARD